MTRFIKVLATFMVAVMLFVGCSTGSGYINTASVQAVWTETETPPVEEPNIIDTKTEDTVSIPADVNSVVSSETTSSETTSSEDTSSETTSSEDTSSEATSSKDTSSKATSSKDTSSKATSSKDTANNNSDDTVSSQAQNLKPSYSDWYSCDVGTYFTLRSRNSTGYSIKGLPESDFGSTVTVIEGTNNVQFYADSPGRYTVTVTLVAGKSEITLSTLMIVEKTYTVEEIFPDIPGIDTGF